MYDFINPTSQISNYDAGFPSRVFRGSGIGFELIPLISKNPLSQGKGFFLYIRVHKPFYRMKLIHLVTSILSVGLLFQSCKDTDEETDPTTQTGSGAIVYLLDGTQTIQLKNQHADYATDTFGGYSDFYVATSNQSTVAPQRIMISLHNITKPGVYTIGRKGPARLTKPIKGKDTWVYLAYSGAINITKLDTTNHIWSGKFSANLSIESIAMQESWETKPEVKDSISIPSGWFDLPLTKLPY
jgi:hypothetical protein